MRRLPKLLIGCAIAMSLIPNAAQAGTVDTSEDVWFKAKSGESNDLTLRLAQGPELVWVDEKSPLAAKGPCDGGGAPGEPVRCPVPSRFLFNPVIRLGDRADEFDATDVQRGVIEMRGLKIVGGGGGDRIDAGPYFDAIRPGKGDDVVDAGLGGDDILMERGLDGDDRLDGGGPAPQPGVLTDALAYDFRSSLGVRIDLEKRLPQGRKGEADRIEGFYDVYGTAGNDRIFGTDTIGYLTGEGGDDFIDGRGGDDLIDGGDGNDVGYGRGGADDLSEDSDFGTSFDSRGRDEYYGGEGDDFLAGSYDNDLLDGGAGNDALRGNKGNDRLFGRAGDDQLNGIRAGSNFGEDQTRDLLDCGDGDDGAAWEPDFDRIVDCERLRESRR